MHFCQTTRPITKFGTLIIISICIKIKYFQYKFFAITPLNPGKAVYSVGLTALCFLYVPQPSTSTVAGLSSAALA